MTNHLIYGNTYTLWKTTVVQGSRDGTVFDCEFMNQGVDFLGFDPRTDFRLHQTEGINDQTSGIPDPINILFFLEPNLVSLKIEVFKSIKLRIFFSKTALFVLKAAPARAGIVSAHFLH